MNFTVTPEQEELRERAHATGAEFREANATWDEEDDAPYHETRIGRANSNLPGRRDQPYARGLLALGLLAAVELAAA